MKIVVYGTLKDGCSNNHILSKSEKVSDCIVRGFKLYYSGFPVAIPSETDVIAGEVWDINDDRNTLQRLDNLEGYNPGSHTGMYTREPVKAFLADGQTIEAQMYVGGAMWRNGQGMRECLQDSNDVFYWKHGAHK